MTIAFTSADLPVISGTANPAITTIEQLHAWTTAILAFNYNTEQYQEAPNTNNIFRAINPTTSIPDGRKMRINRVALEVDQTLEAQGLKLWQCVKGFDGDTAIPATFKIGAIAE